MSLAPEFFAITADTGIATAANARDFYRSLGLMTGFKAGVCPSEGDTDAAFDPFGASPDGSAVLPLAAGRTWCSGEFARYGAGNAGTHADRTAGQLRIDTIIDEADFAAKTRALKILQGANHATTPVPPTLVRDPSTKWQEPLYDVAIDAGTGAPTIVAADVTDRRFGPHLVHQIFDTAGVGANKVWDAATGAPALGDGNFVSEWTYLRRDLIRWRVAAQIGSTTTFGDGNWIFEMPDGLLTPVATIGGDQALAGFVNDSGTGARGAIFHVTSNTGIGNLVVDDGTPPWGISANTIPISWANGDTFGFGGLLTVQPLTDALRPASA